MEIKGPVCLTASCRLCPWGTERAPERPFWNSLSLQDTVCEFSPAGKLTRCSDEVIQGMRLQESYRLGILQS